MGKKKLKKFVVSWDEHHFVEVEAKDESEAWEEATSQAYHEGDTFTDIHNEEIREVGKDEKD